METRPQILIADDHVIFADGLRLLLEKHYSVVGTVKDGRALVSEAVQAQARRDRCRCRHASFERT